MAHTKGTWKIVDHPTETTQIRAYNALGEAFQTIRIADVWATDLPYGMDNAKLIAAAPRLLAECKAMHGWLMEIMQSECRKVVLEMDGAEKVDLADVMRLLNELGG